MVENVNFGAIVLTVCKKKVIIFKRWRKYWVQTGDHNIPTTNKFRSFSGQKMSFLNSHSEHLLRFLGYKSSFIWFSIKMAVITKNWYISKKIWRKMFEIIIGKGDRHLGESGNLKYKPVKIPKFIFIFFTECLLLILYQVKKSNFPRFAPN